MNVPIWRNKIVLTALLGLISSIVLEYLAIPQSIWLALDGFLVILIGTWAIDDAATKVVESLDAFTSELRAARLLALGKKAK